jgi:hypothetical protein
MSEKSVIVTVDRKKVPQLDDVLARLKREGLEVDRVDTVLDVTHIIGRYRGDVQQLNTHGVVAEHQGWSNEV